MVITKLPLKTRTSLGIELCQCGCPFARFEKDSRSDELRCKTCLVAVSAGELLGRRKKYFFLSCFV